LSAQICSLSSPAEVATWGAAKKGFDQFPCTWRRLGETLSMWETVIASVLFWPFCVSGPLEMTVSVRFVARV
jgi:hypothetical protein